MQQERGALGVAVVNGKIYAMGGYAGSGKDLTANEEYNPATDSWLFKSPMPTPKSHFGIAVYQNKIYTISGANGANEVYDPTTDTWENKTALPNPRVGITANAVNGKIYVIGGASTSNDEYDPATDSWTTKMPLPFKPPGQTFASVVLDNKVHVFNYNESGKPVHQVYNPMTDKWTYNTTIVPIFAVAGATTDAAAPKRIYLFGSDRANWGSNYPEFLNIAYDPNDNNSTNGASMHQARFQAGVAAINDTFYVIGGFTPFLGSSLFPSATNEQYIPIDYGTVNAPSPSASPSASSSPIPTASPSPTPTPTTPPTQTPTPSPSPPATQQPTPSNSTPTENNNTSPQSNTYWIVTAAAVGAIGLITTAAIIKRKNKNPKQHKTSQLPSNSSKQNAYRS